jgi:hypothetical protein
MSGALRTGAWALAGAALMALWLFPDAIARWRRARAGYFQMDPTCRLADGPCGVDLPGGGHVRLAVEPEGAPAATPLSVRVTIEGAAVPEAIELSGLDMNMGFFRHALHPAPAEGAGTWTATVVLPVCTRDRMAWRADVVLEDAVAGFVLWSEKP